jgi:hypothetical protein
LKLPRPQHSAGLHNLTAHLLLEDGDKEAASVLVLWKKPHGAFQVHPLGLFLGGRPHSLANLQGRTASVCQDEFAISWEKKIRKTPSALRQSHSLFKIVGQIILLVGTVPVALLVLRRVPERGEVTQSAHFI